jgi:hypothetical protein
MSRRGWWQQLQSGEYTETKVKYGSNNWVTFGFKTSESSPKPSPKPFSKPSPKPNIQSPGLANKTNQLKPLPPNAIKEPQIEVYKRGNWWFVEGSEGQFSTEEQANKAADVIRRCQLGKQTGSPAAVAGDTTKQGGQDTEIKFSKFEKEPQITISKIQMMLNEGFEANKLHEFLSSALKKLQEIYKTNKSVFSNKDIVFLKNVSNIDNSLMLLIKTKEELVQQINQFRKQYPNS